MDQTNQNQNQQSGQFKCPGNCLQCLPAQRQYCASQHAYSNMKVLDKIMETLRGMKNQMDAMQGTVAELSAKIEAIQNGGFEKAVIIGGTAAVPYTTRSLLIGRCKLEVTRLSGPTAIETAEAIADWCVDEKGMSANCMGVATFSGYHDALAGAALCGRNNSVLLLVQKYATADSVQRLIEAHPGQVDQGCIFGGTAAVTTGTENSLNSLL